MVFKRIIRRLEGLRTAGSNRPGGIALALQGGGSLGAFTWGVLDRLLDEPDFRPSRLSGASAGAVNAAAFAAGWATDGPEGARNGLDRVWRRVGECGVGSLGFCPTWAQSGLTHAVNNAAFAMATRFFSPYALNPLGFNPLRSILLEEVDFQALRLPSAPPLIISATRVSDGQPQLFGNENVDIDSLLASTTLPTLHQAVEIEGEAYWDGGYTLNPPIRALLDGPSVGQVLVVQAMANCTDATPRTASAIRERLNQITFSRPLEAEIALVREVLSHGEGPEQLDILSIDPQAPGLDDLTGLRIDMDYLLALKAHGRAQAAAWLEPRPATGKEEVVAVRTAAASSPDS
ncbi:patatin-like phospholipase family protein [Niveispirillum fermenti]|uniref:patatin-like phospholipase family protein n=1 Tax=Niveispirillum fermenti TaxID=1233113 RepID=UPI003A841C89